LSPGVGKDSPADPLLQRIPQEKLREVTEICCHVCGVPSISASHAVQLR
jgi:hypothetical protein